MAKTNQQVAVEVLMGKWGNGEERKKKLWDAGYSYEAVQSIVNALVAGDSEPQKEETDGLQITGTETMKIEVDLTKYNAIELTFTGGEE